MAPFGPRFPALRAALALLLLPPVLAPAPPRLRGLPWAARPPFPGARRPTRLAVLSALNNAHRSALPVSAPLPREVPQDLPQEVQLPECPDIIWNAEGIDVDAIPTDYDTEFLKVLEMRDLGISEGQSHEEQAAKIAGKRGEILDLLKSNGAVHLKSVPMAREMEGYKKILQVLGLRTCQDSLARAKLSGEGKVMKVVSSVNGLEPHHDRSDYTPQFNLYDETVEHPRMPWYSAFVCFAPACQGGEFQLLDAQRFVRELDRGVLRRIYERRFRGAEVFGLYLPQSILTMVVGWAKKVLPTAFAWKWSSFVNPAYTVRSQFRGLPKGWNNITTPPWVFGHCWRCEVLVPPQSPVNRHPGTGEVVWFNNILFWEGDRMKWNPKFIDLFIPRSRPVYGDGSEIPQEDIDHINWLSRKNKVNIPMVPGDVVLVDNYRHLHGREGFVNAKNQTRLHAISSGQDWNGPRYVAFNP